MKAKSDARAPGSTFFGRLCIFFLIILNWGCLAISNGATSGRAVEGAGSRCHGRKHSEKDCICIHAAQACRVSRRAHSCRPPQSSSFRASLLSLPRNRIDVVSVSSTSTLKCFVLSLPKFANKHAFFLRTGSAWELVYISFLSCLVTTTPVLTLLLQHACRW